MTGRAVSGRSTAAEVPVRAEGVMHQFLRPDGTVNPDCGLDVRVAPELARSCYREMVLARRFDQEAYHLQRQGELGLWLSSRGQEAAQVGSARALRETDWIFPAYREHAVGLLRGLSPTELLSQWRGCSHGGWDPALYRMHIYSLVLGTQTLHATGYAMGVRLDGTDEVVLTYFGDGATSQGDVNEAFNWAAVTGSPIVFFCQNNQWAISTPAAKQTATAFSRRAAGFGLDAVSVDGNDVLAVHAATLAVVDRVRAGGAPGFVEARTYRMAGHSTSDDPTRYRDTEETQRWQARDPLNRLRTYLDNNAWSDPSWLADLDEEADQLAADARAACLGLPEPRLEDVFDATLVHKTAALAAERASYTAYEESFL
ncbi:thiamine pyrophosphate-dependent dehydrogenase E1 component subunit alpha [Dactylosporangium sp. CA-233914]|uniref:thiamine pyrophosphate-dependent dehydrogenase E1 component subunit alpha n=1 Tax=Dactylosporangium sp. CA-233914 TaxID=3239934 RepID=UPI003D8CE0D9